MALEPGAHEDQDLPMEDVLSSHYLSLSDNAFSQFPGNENYPESLDEVFSFTSSLSMPESTSLHAWEPSPSMDFSNFELAPSLTDYASSTFEPSIFSSRPGSLYSSETRPSSTTGEASGDQFQHASRHAGKLPLLGAPGDGWVESRHDEFGHEDTTTSQKVAHNLSAIRSAILDSTQLTQQDFIKLRESILFLAADVEAIQQARFHSTQHISDMQGSYQCLLCESLTAFSKIETFLRHLETRHWPRAIYLCPMPGCDRRETRRDKILMHCKDKHLKRTSRIEIDGKKEVLPSPPSCQLCTRGVSSWAEFYKCVANHSFRPKYESPLSTLNNPDSTHLALPPESSVCVDPKFPNPVPKILDTDGSTKDTRHFDYLDFEYSSLNEKPFPVLENTTTYSDQNDRESMDTSDEKGLEIPNKKSHLGSIQNAIFDLPQNGSSQPQLGGEELDSDSDEPVDLDPVLDADAYYAKLESFERKVAEKCGLSKGPPSPSDIAPEDLKRACVQNKHALEYLRSKGFCGETMSIVVEDMHVPDIAHVIRLSVDDIDWTSGQFLPSPEAALLKGRCFQEDVESNSTGLITSSMQQLLTTIVKIGILSFSGSHVCRFDTNLWEVEMNEIPVGSGLSFRPRELACLRGFIGGPVWVLGKIEGPFDYRPLKLSMLVQDIQVLWGPAWLVGRTPEEGKFIRTERGYIVPLQREANMDGAEAEYSLPIDAECHWRPFLEPQYRDEQATLLTSTSRILIGTDVENQTGLVFNLRCQSAVQRFQKVVANNHTIPGVREEYFSFEDREFQIGFQSQHGPVVNMNWVHKRHPMRSMKETIISSYTNTNIDDRKFLGVLKLRIGLEISACTGNAQRITLWDALRLSRTDVGFSHNTGCKHAVGDLGCIKSCWSQLSKPRFLNPTSEINQNMTEADARQMLIDSILALKHTGINQRGNLEAYWPFVDVPTNYHMLSTKHNRWFNLIQDTTRAATFAVISQRCLEFFGRGTEGVCSKLTQGVDFQSRQTCLYSQVLPRREPRSKIRLVRPHSESLPIQTFSPLQGVQLGGMFRVWKMSLRLERVTQGEEKAVVASTSISPRGFMSPWTIPDFEEVINSEFALEQTVPVVICSNEKPLAMTWKHLGVMKYQGATFL